MLYQESNIYKSTICQFSLFSYHETFLKSEEECNKVGGYLADVLDNDENNWIKSVLNVINPKDGTDYWLGGKVGGYRHNMYWMTGNLFKCSVLRSQKLKSRSSIVCLHCTILRQCNRNWDLSKNDILSLQFNWRSGDLMVWCPSQKKWQKEAMMPTQDCSNFFLSSKILFRFI